MKTEVELLVLGAGWTSQFLLPLAKERGVTYQATTQDGRDDTLKWSFDPESDDPGQFDALPLARYVLQTFPTKVQGGARRLVENYNQAKNTKARFILLGSTGIWDGGPTLKDGGWAFTDRHSPYDKSLPRAQAEDELLATTSEAVVLNLAGLWGGGRSARNFLSRVVTDKTSLASRTSIHMIHGEDVSRGVLAVLEHWEHARGQRWILTDTRIYDWWDLISDFGNGGLDDFGKPAKGDGPDWVNELMKEAGVYALPRTPQQLGRAISSSEFWNAMQTFPRRGRVS